MGNNRVQNRGDKKWHMIYDKSLTDNYKYNK